MNIVNNFIFIIYFVDICYAWDTDQLEVFDIVEEVKVNFYEALNVSQDADSKTIRSAFRTQSLLLHPDKNPDVDTSEQFRNLVSIYEVLKDNNKRKHYDDVLANGLPNWRSAVYYYRHVRHMGLFETTIILFVVITVGQYIVSWASYWEQKYTLDQVKGRKLKKIISTIEIPKPSFKNTLPFQIPRWIYHLIFSLPYLFKLFTEKAKAKVEEYQKEESEEEEIMEQKFVRKRKPGFILPEGPTFEIKSNSTQDTAQDVQPVPVSGGLWTDDDLEQLIALVKKYPGGTSGRWDLIADTLGRSVPEVTYMANKMKSNGYRLPSHGEEETLELPKVKQKTKGGKLGAVLDQQQVNTNWNQEQQRALEDALMKYPKGALERWDRIAEYVAGKSKEECVMRYKHLVETLKGKKETQELDSTV